MVSGRAAAASCWASGAPTGALRAFGTKHIHKVTNNGLEPAVSVHVYSPALVEMNALRRVDGGRLRLSGRRAGGVNW